MITLQHDGTGLPFVTIKRTSGNTRDHLVAYDGNAIGYNRDESTNKGNIKRLPLSRGFSRHGDGQQESVQGTVLDQRWLKTLAVGHLNFIPSAKVHSTVTVLWIAELDMEFEIIEFLVGYDIGT
jgi:hypothetical protein